MNHRTMTLEEFRALPECVNGKGIYFLWLDEELLYIGASTNVVDRINRQEQLRDFGHVGSATTAAKKRIPFNLATIFKWDGAVQDMADAEKYLIKKFRPPYNDHTDKGDEVWGDVISNERRDRR